MNNINDFLNDLEKLAYKILLWALFIPKTLLKIILDPNWVPGYIKQELSKDSKKAFDNYMSPVVLFIIVSLFPAIIININTPTLATGNGMVVYEPKPYKENDLRNMVFTAEAKLSKSISNGFKEFRWEIWQVDQVDQNGNSTEITYGYDRFSSIKYYDERMELVENPSFTFVYGEIHDKANGAIPFTLSNTGEPIPEYIETLKSNTPTLKTNIVKDITIVNDTFNYRFNEGEYQVRIFTEITTPLNEFNWIETIYITVPQDISQPIYYASEIKAFGEDGTTSNTDTDLNMIDSFMGGLESSRNYFLALGLLALPLIFSFGTKAINSEESFSLTGMQPSFYIQCYYLSPVAIVFWASLLLTFSSSYFTVIEGIALLMTWVSVFLILFWFLSTEVRAIKNERGISIWKAWGILFMLMLIFAGGIALISFAGNNSDSLISSSLKLYSITAAGVWIAYIFKRRRERKAAKEETSRNCLPS